MNELFHSKFSNSKEITSNNLSIINPSESSLNNDSFGRKNDDNNNSFSETLNSEFDLNGSDYHLIQDDFTFSTLHKRNFLDKLRTKFNCISSNQIKDLLHSSSLLGTSFNFVNSIIGSGVIGIPYAISQSGFGVSFLLFFLVGFLTDYSLIAIIKTGEKLSVKTYQDLVDLSLGRYGFWLLVFIQFLYPFIFDSKYLALVSYHIIIGDTVTKVFVRLFNVSTNSLLNNRHLISLLVSAFILVPLSSFRNISRLSKTSFLSCLLLIFIQIAMIIRLFTLRSKINSAREELVFYNNFDGITDSFSLLAFAFMCHHNSFLLYNSMNNPTVANWKTVTHSSVFTSMFISLIFGMVGYLTFKGFTQGDIFENYCHKDDLINVVRLFYSTIIMFSFPLELFVCRDVIENTFFAPIKGSLRLHASLTIIIILITMFLSYTTDCLGIVLEINGSLVSTILAYILPCLCAIIINHKQGKYYTESLKSLIVLSIGLVVLVSGLISIFHKIRHGYNCSHGTEMTYCKKVITSPTDSFPALANTTSMTTQTTVETFLSTFMKI